MSWKTEYILKVSYFLLEITCYKLPQHQAIVFPWHLNRQYIWFWQRVLSTKWRSKLLIHKINLTGHKNVHVAYGSWFSWWQESSLCIWIGESLLFICIGDPRFFLSVSATINSQYFVKLSSVKYYIGR